MQKDKDDLSRVDGCTSSIEQSELPRHTTSTSGRWALKRVAQCVKCPWRKDVNPREIPNGYSVEKHQALERTIARPGDVSGILSSSQHIMACHETHDAHCIGWLVNQIGVGNNIALRIQMLNCENVREIRTIGAQHQQFRNTLPKGNQRAVARGSSRAL